MKLEELTPEAIVERGQLSFGHPRAIRVAESGRRLAFLRSPDPLTGEQGLWLLEAAGDGGWSERRVDHVDPVAPATESAVAKAMRERTRELAGGIIGFTADAELATLVFASGGLWRFADGALQPLAGTDGAEEPLLSSDGRRLAFLSDGTLRVLDAASGEQLARVEPRSEHELVGRPDFIAAEEIGRFDGMWWDPAGERLLFQRTDDSNLPEWTIPRPGDPAAGATTVRYPAANGPNASVELAVLDVASGAVSAVQWDAERYPYLCRGVWSEPGGLTIDVQSRDQRALATLAVDPVTGTTHLVAELRDPLWVEPGNGTRAHGPAGELCRLMDVGDVRTLAIGDVPVELPERTHALDVLGRLAGGVLLLVSVSRADRRVALARWDGTLEWLSDPEGVAAASGAGETVVVEQRSLAHERPQVEVRRGGKAEAIATHAEPLEWEERVELFLDLPDGGSAAALLLPMGHDASRDGPLPVLLDPYGGPLFARVSRDRRGFALSRWLAEQGYAVLVVDGLGAPGRSPSWERGIAGELTRTLDSQIAALEEVARRRPGLLDLEAVGIRGWSFGGYLAALAAIRRPDVIRVAAVGAPVSDWRLYDTHYTERYLGVGDGFEEAAERNGLAAAVAQAGAAGRRPSPMLIIHGFEDDNVVVAHSIRLSEALTARGVPHASLLLPSLTHVGRTSILAQVQRVELDFLDRVLKV